MTVRELITSLLEYPMNNRVELSIRNEDTETTTYSYLGCDILVLEDNNDDETVKIFADNGYEGSQE